MKIPENLYFTKDHEWLKVDGNLAVIGITDFAQSELGDIVYLEVDTVNETLEKEETFGTIEAVKTVSDMYMPVNGKITKFNEELEDNPELVNKDPYGEGWIIEIELSDVEELKQLLSTEQYKELTD